MKREVPIFLGENDSRVLFPLFDFMHKIRRVRPCPWLKSCGQIETSTLRSGQGTKFSVHDCKAAARSRCPFPGCKALPAADSNRYLQILKFHAAAEIISPEKQNKKIDQKDILALFLLSKLPGPLVMAVHDAESIRHLLRRG